MFSSIRGPALAGLFMGSMFLATGAAAAGQWQVITPEGGDAEQLIAPGDGKLYLVTDSGGIYASSDEAAHWSLLGNPDGLVNGLAVDPSDDSHLVVATTNRGVDESHDGGRTWKELSYFATLRTGAIFQSVVIRNDDPDKLFVLSRANGLLKSVDAGASWANVSGFPKLKLAATLVIDPSNPAIMYVGSEKGIHKTINGGQTWVAANNGTNSAFFPVQKIIIDPSDHNRVFAVAQALLYLSVDGGGSWTPLDGSAGLGNGLVTTDIPTNVAIDPSNSNNVTATFSAVSSASAFYSSDGGAHWSPLAAFITVHDTQDVNAAAISPANGARIILGTQDGVYLSTDTGASWAPSNAGFDAVAVQGMSLDTSHAGVLYAVGGNAGAFRSSDSGQHWTSKDSFTGSLDVTAIGLDPKHPSRLYTAQHGGSMLASPDGGTSWSSHDFHTSANSGLAETQIVVDPHDSAKLYAYDHLAKGVITSVDGGHTWALHRTGLPAQICGGCQAVLAIDPTDSSTLYLAIDPGVYKSIDSGKTWKKSLNGIAEALAVNSAGTVFAGLFGQDLYTSSDGGAHWTATPDDSEALLEVDCVAIDPHDSQRMLVNDLSSGVSASVDGGQTWMPMDGGLLPYSHGSGACSTMAFDPVVQDRYFMVISASVQTYSGPLPAPAKTGGSGGTSSSGGGGGDESDLMLLILAAAGMLRKRRESRDKMHD